MASNAGLVAMAAQAGHLSAANRNDFIPDDIIPLHASVPKTARQHEHGHCNLADTFSCQKHVAGRRGGKYNSMLGVKSSDIYNFAQPGRTFVRPRPPLLTIGRGAGRTRPKMGRHEARACKAWLRALAW